jgi:hypothetical protein
MQRKKRIWPKLIFILLLGAALTYFLIWMLTPDLTGLADKQLKAIQEDQLSEAYHRYTSKEYQTTTSYDSFKQFVISIPLLQNFKSVRFSEVTQEGDKAEFKANLEGSGTVDATVNYQLVKEESQWKIAGFEVHEHEKPGTAMSTATLQLIGPVEAQLRMLKLRDFVGAYRIFTTTQFQEKTPFSKFKSFILGHPILTQFESYDFKNHFFDNGKGVVTVVLNPEKEAAEVQYTLISDGGTWKILLMKATAPEAKPVDVKELLSVVENELNALRSGDLRRAYFDYLSDQLKAENTLEVFETFVKKYPIFFNFDSINILEPFIEENIARVTVELKRAGNSSEIEYILEMESEGWKIAGMHVETKSDESETVQQDDTKHRKMREMIDVIHSFLDALKHQEYHTAYEQWTSENFKKNNTDKDLQFFVETNPDLVTSDSSTFERLIFNNNIATLSGSLILPNNKSMPVEFDLIEEEGKWKILHLFAMPVKDIPKITIATNSGGTTENQDLQFQKIIIGSQVNDQGIVTNPQTSFAPDVTDLYLNLYVANGKTDTPVEVTLRHIESGSSIPPVNAVITNEGDSMISLVFSPPPKGWPKGSYQIRASANAAVFKTFTFNVE